MYLYIYIMIQEPPFSSTPITWPGHHGRVQVSSAENRRDGPSQTTATTATNAACPAMAAAQDPKRPRILSMFCWLRNWEVDGDVVF